MYFLLQSEIRQKDPLTGHIFKDIRCPYCNKSQLYKLDSNDLFTKYQCWNKECEMREEPFIVINEFIANEIKFDPYCKNCRQPYLREFKNKDDIAFQLLFACDGKLCGMYDNPYVYDLNTGLWIENLPEFRIFEEDFELEDSLSETSENESTDTLSKNKEIPEILAKKMELSNEESGEDFSEWRKGITANIDGLEMPLLTMTADEYANFLEMHNGRVVVLIDVPNFLRTLYSYYRNRFDRILTRAHILLLKFIEDYFLGQNGYIIRYFSKPDDDLRSSNKILADCAQKSSDEYFHMLRIHKSGSFSDIDNYLISNAVEILERCDVKGFGIVSSDKDYLPVMRIADYRGVKSCMIGINTSDIYERYNIGDIKFLNVLNYSRTNKLP
ncbi:MAG: hypothetical protein GF311_06430 [Candidatus Lokiarchaeota archaeon]|nr:hypothetical protein [Candidatus Lokiarchaeota archaeon]